MPTVLKLLVVSAILLIAAPAFAAFSIEPGKVSEFEIELPLEVRQLAGDKKHPSPAKTVKVVVFAPTAFDAARSAPVMVISATSDPGYNSSIALLRRYSEAAESTGWVLVAADPVEKIGLGDDTFQLRYVMVSAALDVLGKLWPPSASAPIAFGGYSGGAKHSGVLAASIAARGRVAVGVFQGGINSDTLALAMKNFKVPRADYEKIRVFLAGGERDEVATPDAHRQVAAVLKKAGFKNIRIEFNDRRHGVDPEMLKTALKWFAEAVPAEVDN
jgi:hypothetical protein